MAGLTFADVTLSAHLQAFDETPSPDLQLFRSERRTPLSRRSIQDIISQTTRRAAINRIPVSAHTLRHYAEFWTVLSDYIPPLITNDSLTFSSA